MKTVFRYPGGKTKLAAKIIQTAKNQYTLKPFNTFVDVFVGGGSVTIKAMQHFNVVFAVNDLDQYIGSFWKLIADNNIEELIGYIKNNSSPTVEDYLHHKNKMTSTNLDPVYCGFLALYFNRTSFSGIKAKGPIGGLQQKGRWKIGCRYKPDKLVEGIRLLGKEFSKRRTKALKKDFLDVIKEFDHEDCFMYVDPPYMKQGKDFYLNYFQKSQYEELAALLKNSKCRWILSHDNNEEFLEMYKWANITTASLVSYTINSHVLNKRREELFITNFD